MSYPSKYKDSHLAFWLEAIIHQLDTHVLWSAKIFTRSDKTNAISSRFLFTNYFCDAKVLHEFIKRGLVTKIRKGVKIKHISAGAWDELLEIIETRKIFLSIPLNEESAKRDEKYRNPDYSLWFEIVIDSFSDELVRFSLSLYDYKYILSNLELNKHEFYEFEDRLEGKIRFTNNWFPLEELLEKLDGPNVILKSIETDLKHELGLLKKATNMQIQSSCRSLFPLLERVLRDYCEKKKWRGKISNMDHLINRYDEKNALSKDSVEILRFISKPMRDYIEHGREIGISVAKVVLASILESLIRINSELEVG